MKKAILIKLISILFYSLVMDYFGTAFCYGYGAPEIKQTTALDLNSDGKIEHISGLQKFEGEAQIPVGLFRICSTKECDGPALLGEIELGDHFDRFDLVSLNNDQSRQILAWSVSGMHSTGLTVLTYENGEVKGLFNKGSAADVEFKQPKESKSGKPEIWVGRANWKDPNWNYAVGERLWEVHVWNGKEFIYDEKLSTSPLLSEWDETSRYIQKYKELEAKEG